MFLRYRGVYLGILLTLMVITACGPADSPSNPSTEDSTPTAQVLDAASESDPEPTLQPLPTAISAETVDEAAPEPAVDDVVLVDDTTEPVAVQQESEGYFLGAANAAVTIIEYSDFQCPFCQRHTIQTMPLIKEKFIDTGRLRYEFRDFPIASLHPLAYRLHEAAYCAGDSAGESAYWLAHELFFSQPDQFKINSLAEMDTVIVSKFATVGLPDVSACLLDNRFAEKVQENVARGSAAGVTGTPAFFIGEYQISGAQPYAVFADAIVAAEEGRLAELIDRATQPPAVPAQVAALPTPTKVEPRPATGLGDPEAAVTIVEFSDYQCPFCKRHALETMPQIKQLIDEGRVYYEFKDFPIPSLHPLAHLLHEAALCVQDSAGTDAFWSAHNLFFERSDLFQQDSAAAMDSAIATGLAEVNLWDADIESCYANRDFADEVNANGAEGRRLGLSGTPSFFIDGYLLVGALPFETFAAAIQLAEEGGLAEALRPQAQPEPQNPTPTEPQEVSLNGDEPEKGAVDAPVTIIEFSSYQCPFCKRHFDQTMPLIQPYIANGTVRYIFKDFPLPNQPQAFKVHEAAHCGREQGGDDGYWAIHDIMFVNQSVWSRSPMGEHVDVIKELVRTADFVDGEAFDNCLDSDQFVDRVNRDLQEGTALNVRGTPSFFLNGNFISGAQPFEVFKQAIELALQSQ